jgi:hypothetical protein
MGDNDKVCFKKVSLFCLFFTFIVQISYSQKNIKINVSKIEIEKKILGHWNFKKLTSESDIEIKERVFNVDTLSVREKIDRPDFVFFKDKKYIILRKKDTIGKGTWSYSEKEKELFLKYNKPKYNIPIETLSEEIIKSLKASNRLIKFEGFSLEINKLTNNVLIIIEHNPHTENEIKYNLRYYEKKDNDTK